MCRISWQSASLKQPPDHLIIAALQAAHGFMGSLCRVRAADHLIEFLIKTVYTSHIAVYFANFLGSFMRSA
jgi:hypothetical protein